MRFSKLLTIFTSAAVLILTYLTYHHYQLTHGLTAEKSFCHINAAMNCDAVNSSVYSELFKVPVALWAVALYSLSLLFLLLQKWGEHETSSYRTRSIQFLAAFQLLSSLGMAYVTFSKLNSFCLFCSFIWGLSLLIFIFAFMTPSSKSWGDWFLGIFSKAPHGFRSDAVWTIVLLLSPFFINDVVLSVSMGDFKRLETRALQEWNENPTLTLDTTNGISRGASAEKAKMTIVEFADFQCVHCKQAHVPLQSFVDSRSDVRFIFMTFPLDGACNSAIGQSGNGKSCEYAKAVDCAERINQSGWKAHDWIFDRFGEVPESWKSELQATLKIDGDQFASCMESPETHARISGNAKQGEKAGVKGTPSVYVNGRSLPYGNFFPVLKKVYESL